jgi:hypothetical protein
MSMAAVEELLGPYAELAEAYIERGYGALPIIPGTKRPGARDHRGEWIGMPRWQRRYDEGRPPREHVKIWGNHGTGIGILLGAPSGHLVVPDTDTDERKLREAIGDALFPDSPVGKRGQKGESLFYQGAGIKSHTWRIDDKVVFELLAQGRQTVIPPTIHEHTGRQYIWTREPLLNYRPCELPTLPSDIADRITEVLKPFGGTLDPDPHTIVYGREGTAGDSDSPFRQLEDLAMANLHRWIPALHLYKCRPARGGYEAVPAWRPSSSGRPDYLRKLSLKIHPTGIVDFGTSQKYAPIALIRAVCKCSAEAAFNFLADCLDYGNIDLTNLIEAAEASIRPTQETESDAKGDKPKPGLQFLKYTQKLPGVLGEITDWIESTAVRPNRIIALGTAIPVIGTLAGRRIATPTRSALHLYMAMIAESGAGKQQPMDSARLLMKAAGAECHIKGPSRLYSLPALEELIIANPLCLFMVDEWGAFLQSVTSAKAIANVAGISDKLRTLWNTSFGTVETGFRKGKPGELIRCPALSTIGMTTEEEFLAALQAASINNGLVNRQTVLNANIPIAKQKGKRSDVSAVPQDLAEKLQQIYEWNNSPLSIGNPAAEFVPLLLPWGARAEALWDEIETRSIDYQNSNPDDAIYFKRAAEMGIRLASIRAIGRDLRQAVVTVEDLEWGDDLAQTACRQMANAMQDYEPETDRKKGISRIVKWIRRKYPELGRPLTWAEIRRYEGGNVKSSELKDRVEHMVAVGDIKKEGNGYAPVGVEVGK